MISPSQNTQVFSYRDLFKDCNKAPGPLAKGLSAHSTQGFNNAAVLTALWGIRLLSWRADEPSQHRPAPKTFFQISGLIHVCSLAVLSFTSHYHKDQSNDFSKSYNRGKLILQRSKLLSNLQSVCLPTSSEISWQKFIFSKEGRGEREVNSRGS